MTTPLATEQQPELSQSRLEQAATIDAIGRYAFGWSDADTAGASARRGLNEDVVRDISAKKSEPEWMLERRLKALKMFDRQPMPTWGADLGVAPKHFITTRAARSLSTFSSY